jgi:hypothetical protein
MTTIATTKTRTAIAILAAALSFAAVAGPVVPDAQATNAADRYHQSAEANRQAMAAKRGSHPRPPWCPAPAVCAGR